jgi:hypothetical protein
MKIWRDIVPPDDTYYMQQYKNTTVGLFTREQQSLYLNEFFVVSEAA